MRFGKLTTLAGLCTAAALALSACGATNEGAGPDVDREIDDAFVDCVPGEGSADFTALPDDDNQNIDVVSFNGWIDTEIVAHLTKHTLEEHGYNVTVHYLDAAPGFAGVANGDLDIVASSQLPTTHAAYMEQFGDDLDSLGCWYDNATNTIAVNDASPAQTIADLADMADEYDNRIVGIEPGAGLMRATQNQVIPAYGLEGLQLVSSSTPAMLAELKRAVDSGDNIAVTMWHPHWAYDQFPLRDLEDPEGAFGDPEALFTFTRTGFGEENPKATQLLRNLVIPNELFTDLANLMSSEEGYAGENPEDAIDEWLERNPEFLEGWTKGTLATE